MEESTPTVNTAPAARQLERQTILNRQGPVPLSRTTLRMVVDVARREVPASCLTKYAIEIPRQSWDDVGGQAEACDKNDTELGRPTISSQSPRSERGTVRSARSPLCFKDLEKSGADLFSQIRSLWTMSDYFVFDTP